MVPARADLTPPPGATGVRLIATLERPHGSVTTSAGAAPFGNLLIVTETQPLKSKRDEDVLQVRRRPDCGKSRGRL